MPYLVTFSLLCLNTEPDLQQFPDHLVIFIADQVVSPRNCRRSILRYTLQKAGKSMTIALSDNALHAYRLGCSAI